MTATKAQLDFIATMEEFVNEKFNGATKEEAQLYIQRNIDEYNIHSASNWIQTNGYD